MLWKSIIGGVVGVACSAYHRSPSNVSLALDPPTLDVIMDPSKDITPIRAVIVGGGYAGSRMAYQLDSMFDVTHIDEKNFYELTNDIIPIIAHPWNDDVNPEACRRMMVLHRYYLKRSNVLTGTVVGADGQLVYLKDGRTVPYDLLFVATGERKPFPFGTRERTISGRVQELRRFNEFLQTCKKVAVVGGGPVGTSLAHDLASNRRDLEVHLFHRRAELLPHLPGACRRHAADKLKSNPNLHLHLSAHVTDINGIVLPSQDSEVRSTATLDSIPFSNSAPGPAPTRGHLIASPSSDTATASSLTLGTRKAPWWRTLPRLVWRSHGERVVPDEFTVHYDLLHSKVRRPQSILQQVYYGKQDAVEEGGAVEGHDVEENFDYVFALTGDTPRPIQWDTVGNATAAKRPPNILHEHEMKDGHYRVSTLMQFFEHPNIFGLGRCTNLPVLRCYGSSDIESRTLFRELNSIVNNPTSVFLHSRDGLQLSHLQIPRIHVRLGVDDAVGCTPWSGGMVGVSSVHEFMQDRNFLLREFQRPVFYKQQDQLKIKERVMRWMAGEITDIIDFSHC